MKDPRQRFSPLAERCAKYRPGYPPALLAFLEQEYHLTPSTVVADIGSGTGHLTRLFLGNGNLAYAVEPNQAMRAAAEEALGAQLKFVSIDGSAEETTLPSASVDIVAAGQAFHWFDPVKTRAEFERILTSDGLVALVWNDREARKDGFSAEYESIAARYTLEHDYVDHRKTQERDVGPFFAPLPFREASFDNHQELDYAGLEGRLLSSSYIIPPDHGAFPAMIDELHRLFDRHAAGGRVRMEYLTKLYVGRIR
ncbi:MAG TPA: class I SAM-dependent methyltransferase [Spirochaetia bacterium]|nr:class I SAM-dependent methyltransferase [Spirochaetia bacterium]